ncbi:MAG TPA: hypothetical protein VM052_00200, partial [Candidatus Limnocylindrales bacterium]|nr:hypothetical protein [Candidatus Limnocylindrales bacterium]
MFTRGADDQLVLTEFRLRTPGSSGVVEQIVAIAGGVPLLVSIDDRQDVALLRTGAEHAVSTPRTR